MDFLRRNSSAVLACASGVLALSAVVAPHADAAPTSGQPRAAVLAAAPVSASTSAVPAGWVRTPFGLRKKDCVVAVPNGAQLSGNTMTLASGARRTLKDCRRSAGLPTAIGRATRSAAPPPAPAANGWQMASWWSSPNYLTVLNTRYAVPNAPKTSGALIYLFSSFETPTGDAIIQPVLQYGVGPDGGGNYWTIASWYVGPGGVVAFSPPLKVAPRDTIRGSMKAASCASDGTNCRWVISTQDLTQAGTPQTNLTITTPGKFTEVQGGALETYNATSCSQWPSSHLAAFSGIQVFKSAGVVLTPVFRAAPPAVPVCSAAVTYTSDSTNITWAG